MLSQTDRFLRMARRRKSLRFDIFGRVLKLERVSSEGRNGRYEQNSASRVGDSCDAIRQLRHIMAFFNNQAHWEKEGEIDNRAGIRAFRCQI
jgi:hypothetical protein